MGNIPFNITELTAQGVLLISFIILVKWMVSKLTETLDQINKSLQNTSFLITEMYKLLIMHDAQVRGINPTASIDNPNGDKQAQLNYARLINEIQKLQEKLKE